MPSLYIVATPIGNLEDITLRALRVLKKVDCILAEDTRVTSKLLGKFEIKNNLLSYHEHSSVKKRREIIDLLKKGKDLALVTDAGTPGISDPGGKLISDGARICTIPNQFYSCPCSTLWSRSFSEITSERYHCPIHGRV